MLIFHDGLRIEFWYDKLQRREGTIRFKSYLNPDYYVVNIFEYGKITEKLCTVNKNKITHILIKNMNGNDVWVKIEDAYKIFPNNITIRPDERYNVSDIDVASAYPNLEFHPYKNIQQITTNKIEYGLYDKNKNLLASGPVIDLKPIKDFGEILSNDSLKYINNDIVAVQEVVSKYEFEHFLKEDKTVNFLSFETEHNLFDDGLRCRLTFEIDMKEAYRFEPLMKRARGSIQLKEFGEHVVSAFLDGTNLPKPKKVMFNDPATIVFWEDGTKTVVKRAADEPDDKELAIMYCVFKKVIGNRHQTEKYIKSFMKKEEKKVEKKEEKAGSSKLRRKKSRARKKRSKSSV